MVDVKCLVGKKFVDGGRDVKKGLDCWGLVMEIFKRYGITLPNFTPSAFAFAEIDALAKEAVGFSQWEEVHHPQDGDVPLVVLMRMHPGLIKHVGVFLGGNRLIHTMESTNTVISRVSMLKHRITGYYRYAQDN